MGIYTTWDITAKPIVPYQAEELQGMLDRYECDWYLEDYAYHGSFDTTSVHAEEDIERVMREFSEKHPNIVLEAIFRPEYNRVPDKWMIQAGKVRRFEGSIVYTEITEEDDHGLQSN